MSEHDDDHIDDGLPTMIDPEVPTGHRERPAKFDPHARLKDNRRTPAHGAPGAVAAEVLSALPPVHHEPASQKQRMPSNFDPHARIDDSSRTAKWAPREEETRAEPTASAARRTKPDTRKGHDAGPGVARSDARTVMPAGPEARTIPDSPPLDVSALALPPVPHPPGRPRDRSEPMRVISMKTPGDLAAAEAAEAERAQRVLPVVKLRAISDAHQKTPPRGMGNLAPPRDAGEARSRRVRDNVIWGSVAVILASIVTLAIWFLARR